MSILLTNPDSRRLAKPIKRCLSVLFSWTEYSKSCLFSCRRWVGCAQLAHGGENVTDSQRPLGLFTTVTIEKVKNGGQVVWSRYACIPLMAMSFVSAPNWKKKRWHTTTRWSNQHEKRKKTHSFIMVGRKNCSWLPVLGSLQRSWPTADNLVTSHMAFPKTCSELSPTIYLLWALHPLFSFARPFPPFRCVCFVRFWNRWEWPRSWDLSLSHCYFFPPKYELTQILIITIFFFFQWCILHVT